MSLSENPTKALVGLFASTPQTAAFRWLGCIAELVVIPTRVGKSGSRGVGNVGKCTVRSNPVALFSHINSYVILDSTLVRRPM